MSKNIQNDDISISFQEINNYDVHDLCTRIQQFSENNIKYESLIKSVLEDRSYLYYLLIQEIRTVGFCDICAYIQQFYENKLVCDALLTSIITPSYENYAKLIYYSKQIKYVIHINGVHLWYEFKGTYWRRTDNMYVILLLMITYKMLLSTYTIKNENYFKIKKCIIEMRTYNNRSKIMALLEKLAYDPSFYIKANENRSIICFNNGMFDLNSMTLRQSTSADMITYCTNYDYIWEHTEKLPKLMDFLTKIQPDPIKLDYLLTLLSSMLYKNTTGIITLFVGPSYYSTRSFCKFLSDTFGLYYESINPRYVRGFEFPPTFYTHQHKKIILIHRESSKIVRNNIMQAIVKNEIITCHHNRVTIRFRPFFNLIIQCSKLPKLDDDIMKKCHVVKIASGYNYTTKKNDLFAIDITDCKADFMLLLTKQYTKFLREGLPPVKYE